MRDLKVFSVKALKELKKEFGKFLSKDDLRPVMQYIFYDAKERTLVATNAHILRYKKISKYEAETYGENDFLIHREDLDAMIKANEPYKLVYDADHVLLVNPTWLSDKEKGISHKVNCDMRYPDWKAVVPTMNDKQVIASCDLTLDKNKIKGLSLLSNDASRRIEIIQSDGGVKMVSMDLDFNTEASYVPIESNVVGDIHTGVCGSLLLDVLVSLDCDCLSFSFFGSNRAFVICDEVLLMPILI